MLPTPGKDAALRIDRLRKSYGDVLAVDDLSLDLRRGEILGFLGPNGAGKTTAISMICGLLRPDSGTRVVNGRIGLCPQELVIWESLTCSEQLRFLGRAYDLDRRAAKRRADELLEALGLDRQRHRLARKLSGGTKRRLNIALALVHRPEILILDEPQAGLDPQSRILVREYVRGLAGTTSVILTTHDMDEADRMADRIAIIDHGRLLALDTPSALKGRIGGSEVLELTLLPGQHERLRKICRDEGLRFGASKLRERTLEDVFIALTGRRMRE